MSSQPITRSAQRLLGSKPVTRQSSATKAQASFSRMRQKRYGFNTELIEVFKFRSMY
jgi:lipopolysaccharide/colanic/teichoic acid biosynthesis glycosyltransferase